MEHLKNLIPCCIMEVQQNDSSEPMNAGALQLNMEDFRNLALFCAPCSYCIAAQRVEYP